MVKETKRLADISVEQFKIKSYPVFLVAPSPPRFNSGQFFQEFTMHNRGEIAAHNVSFLLVNVYRTKDNREIFLSHEGTYYKFEDTSRTIDVESKIPAGSNKKLLSSLPLSKLDNFGRFTYSLIFIKFMVPYDTVHRMEVFAYIIKEKTDKGANKLYIWQEMSSSDTKSLYRKFMGTSSKWTETAKSFLTDFRLME